MASGGGTALPDHAEADPKGGDPKKPVKLSDFTCRLSAVDEWSKLNQSQLQKEISLMDPSDREAVKEDITKWKQLTEQEKKKLLRQEKREGTQRGRQGAQRDYSEWIQDSLQGKEKAEQRQRELEERKKLLEASGNSPAGLIQLEQEIKKVKQEQEQCQQMINYYKEALQRTFKEQDEESKRFLEKALQKGHILARMTKCIFTGYAGAGKTSLLCLLLGVKSPTVRCSTPCAESPIRVVSGTRIQLLGEGWVKVSVKDLEEMLASYIPILCDTVPDEVVSTEVQESLFQQQQSSDVSQDKTTPTSQDQAATTSQDSASSISQDQTTSSTSDAPKQATTGLLDDLVKRLNQLAMESTRESDESRDFSNANWIHLIDSGGQPQFYDLLPIFIRHTSSIVLVQRLCDCLNQHPIVEYYDEKGNPIGTPYRSFFTNLEILMCLTRAMHSHPTEGKYPKIMLACTHRDMEDKCSQTRGEKNQTLFKLLHPLFRKDLILYGDAMEPIFPLNTKEPDEEDKRVAKLLRQAIESSASDPVKIPLWWYFLEMALGRLAAMLGRRVLSRKECLSIANNFRFPEEEFDAALQYFDRLNLCLYYPDILPDVVFSDPQVPLDKASELVQHSYKLREAKQGKKSEGPQEALEAEWLKFRDQGIVQLQFLKKFPQHYREGLFTPADLLKLFEQLLIFAPLTSGEYFMPSLLQILSPEELDKQRAPSSSPAAPLIIHFPHGWPRSGIFCCLVVFLINHCQWQVLLPSTGFPILIARNCVKFKIPRSACTVTLIDSYVNFEIHINGPSAVCRKMAPTIRKLLFNGIDAAASTLRYNNEKPQEAFFCCHSDSDSGQIHSNKLTIPVHAATITEDQEYWECTRDADVFGELSEREKVWLQPETGDGYQGYHYSPQPPFHQECQVPAATHPLGNLHSAPEFGDLMNEVATEIPDKWKEVAIGLGLTASDVKHIETDIPTHKSNLCYIEVFDTWKKRNIKKYTWETLLKTLRTKLVNTPSLATALEHRLTS